jgi:AraC family transcriptional regulator
MFALSTEHQRRTRNAIAPSAAYTRHMPERSCRAGRQGVRVFSGLSAEVRNLQIGDRSSVDFTAASWRLIVILETVGGRLTASGPDQRRRALQGPVHAMYLLPPRAVAKLPTGKVRFIRYLDLQFEHGRLAPFFRDGQLPTLPNDARLGFFDARLYGLARMFEAECLSEDNQAPLFGDSLSVSLLTALAALPERAQAESVSGGLTPWQIHRATTFLEEHLAETICPTEVAAMLGLSRSHFCRTFKASTGLPPHAWLIARRIERAQHGLYRSGASDPPIRQGCRDAAGRMASPPCGSGRFAAVQRQKA